MRFHLTFLFVRECQEKRNELRKAIELLRTERPR